MGIEIKDGGGTGWMKWFLLVVVVLTVIATLKGCH
jgi:hypothetical protein